MKVTNTLRHIADESEGLNKAERVALRMIAREIDKLLKEYQLAIRRLAPRNNELERRPTLIQKGNKS